MVIDQETLRIHQFLASSQVNGPGRRAVLWVQGCSLGCPGCFNPETHPRSGGEVVTVEALFQRLLAVQDGLEGLTISGGEPLQQFAPLLKLLQRVRQATSLSVLLFTGFTWQELQRVPDFPALLACVDVLLAGRYTASQRLAQGLIGSASKSVHFLSGRYRREDLEVVPPAEVQITPQGEILLSGIDPLLWDSRE